MITNLKCPRCRNAVSLINNRYYCRCGWNRKRENLAGNSIKYLFSKKDFLKERR